MASMPSLPPGRLTFGQIRNFALRKAGNRAVIDDANIWLTQLLFELYVEWEWPFLMAVATPPTTPTAKDALVPVFPYHLFLVQALYVLALEYEQDPRASDERQKVVTQLAAIRGTAMPLRSQPGVIPLDPDVFGTPFTEDLSGE